jgi:hypothetical protein
VGLYSDIPGRDPAEEAKAEYGKVQELFAALRKQAAGERAECALQSVLPLEEEFFDHAGLKGMRKEAEDALRAAYARAGLPPPALPGDALPGLLEARAALRQAESDLDLSRVEAAFKDVLHHHPGAEQAAAGLRAVQEKQRARTEEKRAGREKRQESLAAKRALPAEEKLLAMADLCHGGEPTPCRVCRFIERTSEPLSVVRHGGVVGATVEGVVTTCAYRRDLAVPLLGQTPPEAGRVMSAWRESKDRTALEPAIARLFERFLAGEPD